MTIEKKCQTCLESKPLGEYFCSDFGGRSAETKTSKHCKLCHAEGRVEYGYGWPGFGGRFATPEDTAA